MFLTDQAERDRDILEHFQELVTFRPGGNPANDLDNITANFFDSQEDAEPGDFAMVDASGPVLLVMAADVPGIAQDDHFVIRGTRVVKVLNPDTDETDLLHLRVVDI